MPETEEISEEAVRAAWTAWFGPGKDGMRAAIVAADRVRGRSYVQWRKPEEFVPTPDDQPERVVNVIVNGGPGHEQYRDVREHFSRDPMGPTIVAWCEKPPIPAWAYPAPPSAPAQSSEADDNPNTPVATTFPELVFPELVALILQRWRDKVPRTVTLAERVDTLEQDGGHVQRELEEQGKRIAALEVRRVEKDALLRLVAFCWNDGQWPDRHERTRLIEAAFPEPKP